jgi:RimJ/RimL family protein N-acetyltransferase
VNEILVGDTAVGSMTLMVDENSTYIERIDVAEEYQGNGYGTQAIQMVAREYDTVFAAPDNEDSQRLFERLGRVYTGDEADYVDQGFGVFQL